MAKQTEQPPRVGTQGWRQFLTGKQEMINAYNLAKRQSTAHEAQVFHGRVAEGEFRRWLGTFLPKRYGVTPGYIISQGFGDHVRAPHFDVIIYDQIESPILWVESSADTSQIGTATAIPAEYVRAVFEVKASWNTRSASDGMNHLLDLSPLLSELDAPAEPYKRYLPRNFVCGIVFFELKKANEFQKAPLNRLVPNTDMPGYLGGLVLHGEGLPDEQTGRIHVLSGSEPIKSSVGKNKESLITGSPEADSICLSHNQHLGVMLDWSEANFARFAFDLIAFLAGTYREGYLSSFHGMSWLNPHRSREAI